MSDPFIIHLLEALRRHEPVVAPVSNGWNATSPLPGACCADVVRREGQRQASNQVTIGNCVTSLRLLVRPRLEPLLRESQPGRDAAAAKTPPAPTAIRISARATAIARRSERLSRGSIWPEPDVARRAIEFARHGDAVLRRRSESAGHPITLPAENHVGYYLVGPGRCQLEQAIEYRAETCRFSGPFPDRPRPSGLFRSDRRSDIANFGCHPRR